MIISAERGDEGLQSTSAIQNQERAVQLAHKNIKLKRELHTWYTSLSPCPQPLSDGNLFTAAFKNWIISISEPEKQRVQ